MTSIQLRYIGPAPGFWWLVADLRRSGHRAVHVPIDRLLADVDVVIDLVQIPPADTVAPGHRTPAPGRRTSAAEDDRALETVALALRRFRQRFDRVEDQPPLVRLVGAQLSPATAHRLVLRDPSLRSTVEIRLDDEPDDDEPGDHRDHEDDRDHETVSEI